MAELASSQPSWVRWLGDSHFSHFSHLLWLRHRDGSHPPVSRAWLVVIRWQPMAAVPRRARPGATSAQPFVRVAGEADGCHRIITSHAPEDGCTDCAPAISRWLKWLWPSHLTQDGCDIASSAMRARPGACGMAAAASFQPTLLRMAALCVLQPSAWRLWLRCS